MRIFIIAIALFLPIAATATSIYINGKEVNKVVVEKKNNDVYITTDPKITLDNSTPTTPTNPEPVPPPVTNNCPANGQLVVSAPLLNLSKGFSPFSANPNPWTVKKIWSGTAPGAKTIRMISETSTTSKALAITTCPIASNDYVVPGCYKYGRSSISLSYNGRSTCKIENGKTYYLLYGYTNVCKGANCAGRIELVN